MHLIDHTDKTWQSKVRRINGAFTYSQDLVKHQIPFWQKTLGENDIISTCPKFSDVDINGQFNLAVQYLHSYPYHQAVDRTKFIIRNLPFNAKKTIFLSAYKAFAHELQLYGLNAQFCPMGIDAQEIQKYLHPKIHKDRIIYFGNVIQNKVNLFNKLRTVCNNQGLIFDYISNGRFNTTKEMTREEILKTISTYKYGIGVGRCAQELMALGVKTLIVGHKFGGLITNKEDYQTQLDTNMNGRITTFNRDVRHCLKHIDKAWRGYNDITKVNHSELLCK